ncbi:SOS response-associated peptidase [Qipengyuania sp. GH38]|uniref:SOS response-associated peptidase n=1 Tax=Qipengyuania intermedia TaxID=2867244 RepID=UPI001C878A4D|nr:SOS response-associated peptidase family protein [Qipengyuania intermedia]MBX7514786.1 SOS response-associated peptidase [Qipengyuania intermedia]
MCNLYRMTKNATEVAQLFDVAAEIGSNAGGEIYPGYSGIVIAGGKVETMTWGFPLQRKGAKGQPLKPKPVNNARTDKLSGPFWKRSFTERRCLIPLESFAEAQGKKGAMTRTWMTIPDVEVFTVAGIWRGSAEWGDCYSMVMTDASPQMSEIHNRMPVILTADQRETWLDGSPDDAFELCRPFEGLLAIDRTDVPWAGRPAQSSML